MKKAIVFLLMMSVIAGFCACPDPAAANPANGGSAENGNTPDTGNSASPVAKPYQRINADGTPNASGEYILFGSYPQTKVTDKATLSALGDYDPDTWTSYGYYINKNVSDFMKYTDKEYDSTKYRGVYFTDYRPTDCAKESSAENSYQDNNGYTLSTVYWFKYEPIKWRILSKTGKEAFLLSETAIDSQQWDFKGGENFSNNYAESTIRAWLNGSFLATAFTDEQQAVLIPQPVEESPDSDRLFLLDFSQAQDYNNDYPINTPEARQRSGSDYAKAQGIGNPYNEDGYCSWWINAPSQDDVAKVNCIHAVGSLNAATQVTQTDVGVVPACRISL